MGGGRENINSLGTPSLEEKTKLNQDLNKYSCLNKHR
jgi:hypothetical protein